MTEALTVPHAAAVQVEAGGVEAGPEVLLAALLPDVVPEVPLEADDSDLAAAAVSVGALEPPAAGVLSPALASSGLAALPLPP